MFISGFDRIDTVTVPDVFMSVIHISDVDCGFDIDDVRSKLESDKDSIDYLGITSDTDPLDYPLLFKAIKEVRPPRMKCLIVTDGRDPSVLDDLVGSGYVNALDLLVSGDLDDDQKTCLSIAFDNKCKVYVTIDTKGQDEGSISSIAKECKGCTMVILRQDRKDPPKKSDLSRLSSAVKKHVWNVRLI